MGLVSVTPRFPARNELEATFSLTQSLFAERAKTSLPSAIHLSAVVWLLPVQKASPLMVYGQTFHLVPVGPWTKLHKHAKRFSIKASQKKERRTQALASRRVCQKPSDMRFSSTPEL